MRRRAAWAIGSGVVVVALAAGSQVGGRMSPVRDDGREETRHVRSAPKRLRWSDEARARALERAVIWQPSVAASGRAEIRGGADGPERLVTCRFHPDAPGGTTPKFECITDAGDKVKVKYSGAEPHGEVAASRLLRALGFPADEVEFVERVRCEGCPRFPFLTMKVLGLIDATDWYGRALQDDEESRDLAWVAVERKHPGVEIETERRRGWSWHELDRVQAPAAHVDALRLLAVFVGHWDNKPANQRLVCLDEDVAESQEERCTEPLLLMQDLGATFGPRKVNLGRWRTMPIWTDRPSCLVSMATMPHQGGTFPPRQITDAGRRFLAARLAALTPGDIRALFEGARFPQHDGEDVNEWLRAFEDKVREISAGPPCPR